MNSGLIKWLVLGAVAASVIANIVLYQTAKTLRDEQAGMKIDSTEVDALRQQAAGAGQVDALTAELETLRADKEELLRLRSEVGQLKGQGPELESLRRQNENLKRQMADLKKAMLLQHQRLRGQAAPADGQAEADAEAAAAEAAQSARCATNLKRIGLAALLWGRAHDNIFPPDFLAMSQNLGSPTVLFCPSDQRKASVNVWQQVDLNEVSYEFLLPAVEVQGDPNQPLARCLVHGSICRADGSVQQGLKP